MQSKRGKEYSMAMVNINSISILVEPIRSLKDAELTSAYWSMMLRLQRAGIIPNENIFDNEVYESMKHVLDNKLNE